MYTGLLDQNRIRFFYKSIGYHIGPSLNVYEENQAKIKIVLADIITPQSRPLDVLVTALHELHIRKTFEMVDTRSKIQLDDLNSNPHGRKSLRYLIDRVISVRFHPQPVSEH